MLCAGTADLSVAEEAAVVAELCGAKVTTSSHQPHTQQPAVAPASFSLSHGSEICPPPLFFGGQVQRIYDVGIAGIHRLFASVELVRQSHACVAVAGMDGALPTVVAGVCVCICRPACLPALHGSMQGQQPNCFTIPLNPHRLHPAGLVQSPVIAVPTSVGYGVGANGKRAHATRTGPTLSCS